jgi:putative membrane protein
MIVRPRPPLWKLFFILKGSIILRILPQIFAVFLLSVLVVWAHRAFPGWVPAVNNGTALALLGIALSIFLGFRNNACYDRWWEARKIWGKLVYTTRGLGRQTLLLENVPGLEDGREKLLRYAIAFSQAMVSHLRPEETGGSNKYDKWLSAEERKALAESRNKPDFILRRLGAALADMRVKDALHPVDFQTLDSSVSALAEVQAACERLRFTPVPFGYTLLLHRTAYLHTVRLCRYAWLGNAICDDTGGLYFLWAGCAGRRAGGAVRDIAQRSAHRGHRRYNRNQSAGSIG